jgi:chemotaxis protein methyltransferase CheR
MNPRRSEMNVMDKPGTHDDNYFPFIKKKILRDTSLDLHQYKDKYIRRRIAVRMHAKKVSTYRDYMRLLSSEPSEYDNLLRDLTINVTHFFRDPEVFHILEEEYLPLMIYDKVQNNRKIIRIWSAGCASGEEPYSLAIILHDLFGNDLKAFTISILATDIDENSLEAAKTGIYPPEQVEKIRLGFLNSYFRFDGEMYHLSDEIKDMVRFKKMDLFTHPKMGNFDIIVCRNVLIYFTKEMQQKLFEIFYNTLNCGGYLVLGKTESLSGEIQGKFHAMNIRERIYQKN